MDPSRHSQPRLASVGYQYQAQGGGRGGGIDRQPHFVTNGFTPRQSIQLNANAREFTPFISGNGGSNAGTVPVTVNGVANATVQIVPGGQQLGPLTNVTSVFPEILNVFVKNLDDSFDVVKLATTFSICGVIQSAKLETLNNGRSKGFGFVCFTTPEEANRAISTFNGKLVGTKPLYVAHYQPKLKRQAFLKAKRDEFLARLAYHHQPNGHGDGNPQFGN